MRLLRIESLFCITVFVLAAYAGIPTAKAQEKALQAKKAQFMFVQTADTIKVDPAAKTLRLVKVNQQVVYFSDRPQRIAGHMTMADFLKEWTARAGKDNFGKDPPNAALSVYEPGQKESTLAVVEITKPVVDGADLVYNFKVIEGKIPAAGGTTSLFIDWVAVNDGKGFGYYGAGVTAAGLGKRANK